MTVTATEAVVFRLVREVILGTEPRELARELSFTDDIEADSLDAFALIVRVEEEFEVEFSEEEIGRLLTVGDLVDAIERKQQRHS